MTGIEFVVDLARRLVTEIAPDELAVFDPVAEAFLRDPARVVRSRPRPGAELGSGIDTIVLELTPAALAVATAVYNCLLERGSEFAVDRTIKMVKQLKRKPASVPAGTITPERLAAAEAGVRMMIEELTGDPGLARRCGALIAIFLAGRG